MAKSDVTRLEKQARARAARFGGVLALLLTLREGAIRGVHFSKTGGYFVVAGKKISARGLQIELQELDDRIAKLMALYAAYLANGTWTLDQWYAAMEKLLEESHWLFAGLAMGGLGAVALSSATVMRRIDRDKGFLRKFKGDIAKGKLQTAPQIKNRSRSYIRSAWITYGIMGHRLMISLGKRECMRILTANESCERRNDIRGCVNVAGVWMDIRKMPPLGSLVCGQYCKCYLIYR